MALLFMIQLLYRYNLGGYRLKSVQEEDSDPLHHLLTCPINSSIFIFG